MSNHKTRPARSNSLQRMLELERRYMLERLQPSPTTKKPSAIVAPVAPAQVKSNIPSTTRLTIQSRSIDDQIQKNTGKPASSLNGKIPVSKASPLVIITSSIKPNKDPTSELAKSPAADDAMMLVSTPSDKPASKAVSFDVPSNHDDDDDDRSSICQSPSWEAYGRRKKEEKRDQKKMQQKREQQLKEQQKKEQQLKEQKLKEQQKKEQQAKEQQLREQKREKEEASKSVLTKKKRLSKQPPPTSSPQAFEQMNRMAPAPAPLARGRPRPASALGLTTPPKQETQTRRSRSRSNSLTSLIMAPFESRRASIDSATPLNGGEFIGGIKLEIERHTAYQRVLQKREKADEAEIHPALRTGHEDKQNLTSAPVKPPSANRPAVNPQHRSYPPITRHATSAVKTRPPISPSASQASDIGAFGKWRSFVGLKPKQDASSLRYEPQPEGVKIQTIPYEATVSASSLTTSSLRSARKTEVAADHRPKVATALSASPTAMHSEPSPSREPGNPSSDALSSISFQQHDKSDFVPTARAQVTSTAEDSNDAFTQTPAGESAQSLPRYGGNLSERTRLDPLSVPPEPPKRSSKRNSIHSQDGSISSLSSPVEMATSRSPSRQPPSSGDSSRDAKVLRPPPVITSGKLAEGAPIASPAMSVDSHTSTATFSTSREHHSHSAKTSIDSTRSRSNELATTGASLRPSTPRKGQTGTGMAKVTNIAVPTWEDIQSSVMHAIETKISLSPIRKAHSPLQDDSDFTVRQITDESVPTTSSSDDSSTDDFHSPSMPSTPDTSRPQSEKELPPGFSDIEQRLVDARGPHVRNDSQSPVRGRALHQLETVSSRGSLTKSPKLLPRTGTQTTTTQLVAKASDSQLPRPVSQPKVYPIEVIPEASFLPRLKHQPLKIQEKLVQRPGTSSSPHPPAEDRVALSGPQSTTSPWPASYLEEARKATPLAPPPPINALGRPSRTASPLSIRGSSTTDLTIKPTRLTSVSAVGGEPIAKMFVECCGCKFYHDLPSNLYEVMANPEAVIRSSGKLDYASAISMGVKCPWCSHQMSTKCCPGYAAMVYLKERLH